MSSVNKVIIIGNLGKEPERRYFQDGTAVCNFSVATSEKWTDKASGEKKEKTEWHRVTAFRKLAEICIQYLRKGSKVYIEGKLQTRSYEKDGQTLYVTEIIADNMTMLDTKGAGGGQGSQGGGQQGGYGAAPSGGYGGQAASGGYGGGYGAPAQGTPDDDIPF